MRVGESDVPIYAPPESPKPLCLYHANCTDGLISAAIVHRFFKGAVECVAIHYRDPVPVEKMRGRHVFMVDFAFELHEMLPHMDVPKKLTIIDHHYDNMVPWVALDNQSYQNLEVVFDNSRSGAGLTWDYFFGGEKPLIVRYAQEYDLWTKGFPDTDQVQSGLRFTYPPHEANLSGLADFLVAADATDIAALKKIGDVVFKRDLIQAEALIKRHLQITTFLEYENIPVCAAPPELANQVGELLYTRFPSAPFVVMFEDNYAHNTRKYSFRSRREGGADVSAIAQQLGGKGHVNSSGALVPCKLGL